MARSRSGLSRKPTRRGAAHQLLEAVSKSGIKFVLRISAKSVAQLQLWGGPQEKRAFAAPAGPGLSFRLKVCNFLNRNSVYCFKMHADRSLLLLRRSTGTAGGPWGWPPKALQTHRRPLCCCGLGAPLPAFLGAPLLAFLVSGRPTVGQFVLFNFEGKGGGGFCCSSGAAPRSSKPRGFAEFSASPIFCFQIFKSKQQQQFRGTCGLWPSPARASGVCTPRGRQSLPGCREFPAQNLFCKTAAAKWPNEAPVGPPKPRGGPPQRALPSPVAQPRLCRIASCRRTKNPVGLAAF